MKSTGKLLGTARGSDLREVIQNANKQANAYYAGMPYKLTVGDADAETETIGGTNEIHVEFYAPFEAVMKEVNQ